MYVKVTNDWYYCTTTVHGKDGLHARPSTIVSLILGEYVEPVEVAKMGRFRRVQEPPGYVDGKDFTKLWRLSAHQGARLSIRFRRNGAPPESVASIAMRAEDAMYDKGPAVPV